MLLPRLQLLLLAANSALAFRDTSPFFLLSSDPLSKDSPLRSAQVALALDVEDRLIDTLSACDKKAYYLVSQEHVRASDLQDGAMPKLQAKVGSVDGNHVVQIPEVVTMGRLSAESVEARLEDACSAQGKKKVESLTDGASGYMVHAVSLPALPSSEDLRAQTMKEADEAIEATVATVLGNSRSSVLIYITTPPARQAEETDDSQLYEMDDPYPSGLHTDLKRNLAVDERQVDDGNLNMQDGLPLFEKYQFLSPALFMGLGVSVLLLSILYVGLSAISGLEVSYAAFSKEMGSQAQKGNKQS